MRACFLQLLDLAQKSGYVILAVFVLRLLFIKAPKKYRIYAWALAAFRLLFPFSIQSAFSLLPAQDKLAVVTATETQQNHTVPFSDFAITEGEWPVAVPEPEIDWFFILAAVWFAGCVLLLLYGVFSYMRLYRKIAFAVPAEKGVYICDGIATPFVCGFLHPKIYIPSGLKKTDLPYVLAHERAHIRRGDHVYKLLAFLLVCVYWFDPLIWFAYILFCRDIEFACDERVLAHLGAHSKKEYSMALLHCASGHRHFAVYPLTFSETGVKSRIKNILNYKKTPFWIAVVTVFSIGLTAVCLLTVPKESVGGSIQSTGGDLTGAGFQDVCFYTESGQQKLSVQWYNKTKDEITFGESFKLYGYQNDKLQKMEMRTDAAFNAIGYVLKAGNSTKQHVYNVSSAYGTLQAGIYRLTALYYVDGTAYTAWCEFAVDITVYRAEAVVYNDLLSSYMPMLSDFAYIVAGKDAFYNTEKLTDIRPADSKVYQPKPKYIQQTFSSELLAGKYKGSAEFRQSLIKQFAVYNGAPLIEIQNTKGKGGAYYLLLADQAAYFICNPDTAGCFILRINQQ